MGENLGSGLNDVAVAELPSPGSGVQPTTIADLDKQSQIGGNDFIEIQVKFIDYVPPPHEVEDPVNLDNELLGNASSG